MLRIVVDTNIWIRALLGGKVSLPILTAFRENKFNVIVSDELMTELREVAQRSRLSKRIDPLDTAELLALLAWYGESVTLSTIPPRCRDPKDHPVLATAIDGHADAIVSGDDDLRADEELRKAMAEYGVQIWGVNSFIEMLKNE
ncbi:MAG: putative toxin-antitoxin system toxin component, PIN family [Chloroflexota bacterium]